MASADKLWFELGVKDEVSKVLEKLMKDSDKLAASMSEISNKTLKNFYKNALDIAGVFDKIHVTQKRITAAQSETNSNREKKRMEDMLKELDKIEKKYDKLVRKPDLMSESGIASFHKTRDAIDLLIKDTLRYVDGIEAQDRAQARNAANEEKRMDSLKDKYYELQRFRKQMTDALMGAAPGVNTGNAGNIINAITARMSAVRRAERNGTGLPASTTGADYEEFLRRVKAELKELTSATNDYNSRLRENERLQGILNKMALDAQSQQKIAGIRRQTEEYNALGNKIREIQKLSSMVNSERAGLSSGSVTTPVWTKDKVTAELEAIQRRYNETLARGRQAELDAANATRRNADSKRKAVAAVRELDRANVEMLNTFNRVNGQMTRNNRVLNQMQSQFAGYIGLYGMERLLRNVIQIGGEFEVQHIALQAILGDVQQANAMFEQMKELAVVSPFNFRQLAAYSKQIAAFGIPYEEMYDTTKRLADMAAGLGVDMQRLILAYGQVRSAAVLRGQELRQFTEAGIPMVQALANEFTRLNGRAVSTAEVFELISKRAVPFEMVKKVMWDMTNEGGRFFDMQFVLSDTLAGKWSNLQDAWEIMLSDIAKGESLSGKFLKGIVSGLTVLVESLNSLMPLLAGGAAFYGMRKFKDAIEGIGLGGINQQIDKAQRLTAISLQEQRIKKQITDETYKTSMALNRSKAHYYVLLANEGKLKNYQIQRLMLQNKINNARLQELVKSQQLTMREAAQVRLWRMKNGEVSAFSMRMNAMWSNIKNFAKANVWMIAIDAVITGLVSWKSHLDEISEKNKELVEGFSNNAKEIDDMVSSISGNTPTSEVDYKSGIDGLKEMLKQHSANYDEIIRETNAIKDLEGQYTHLKIALYETRDATLEASNKAEKFGQATRDAFEDAKESATFMTTGRQSFWDVLMGADTNIKRGVQKSVKKIYEKIIEVIPDVGKNARSNEIYRQLRDQIEEQLGYGAREKMLINIKLNEMIGIDNVEDATTLVVERFGEMLRMAEPKIANMMKYNPGRPLETAEREKVDALIKDAANETIKKYPYFEQTLQGLLNDSNFTANVMLRYSGSGGTNDYQNQVYNNFPSVMDEAIKQRAVNWAKSGNSYEARNAAKRDIDALKNELEARQREYEKGKTTAERVEEARKAYEDAVYAALYGLGYDYEGELKKSNRVSAPGKDEALERAKRQIDEVRKFYSEYKKYRDFFGEKEGQSMVEEIFGMKKGEGDKIVKNYEDVLKGILNSLSINTEDRKKWSISTKQLLGDIKLDDIKTKAKEFYDIFRSELDRQSEKWNLFKSLLEKTGDESFSEMAFKDGKIWDERSTKMRDDFIKMTASNWIGSGSVDLNWDMTDAEAEKFFKNNFSNAEAMYDMWKRIVSLIRGNYLDALNKSAEIISETNTYDEKIEAVRRELRKTLSDIDSMGGDKGLRDRAKKNAEDKISALEWDKFKDENNWGRVFGDVGNMSLPTLRKMIEAMKKYANTTKMSIRETKSWYEAMQKLTDQKDILDPLNGIAEAMSDYRDISDKRTIIKEQIGRIENDNTLTFSRKKELIDPLLKEFDRLTDGAAEALNRLSKAIKVFGSNIQKLGSSLSQLGSSIGGDFGDLMNGVGGILGDVGSGMNSIGELAASMKTGGFSGAINKVSAAVGIISSIVSMNKKLDEMLPSTESIYEKYAKQQQEINKAQERINDYYIESMRRNIEETNWLYTNGLSEMRNNGYIKEKLLKEYANSMLRPQEIYEESRSGLAKWGPAIVGAIVGIVVAAATWGVGSVGGAALGGAITTALGGASSVAVGAVGAAIAAGAGAAINTALRSAADAILYKEGQTSARANMRVQTQHASFWRGEKTMNLEDWVREEYGRELFDEDNYGLIDIELAKNILDGGVTLAGETRETLERLVEYSEKIREIQDQAHEYVSQMFSPVVDDMTNALWDWLTNGEDMLDNFSDYASNTFQNIAKDAVKSFLKINLLDKYQGKLDDLATAYSLGVIDEQQYALGAASIAGDIKADFEMLSPVIQAFGETLTEAFGLQGYDIAGGSKGGSSSTTAIKSITEGTAELISSYINAIRADTGMNRMMVATYYPQFANLLAQGNVIANSQLTQMQMISDNTSRNAESAALIYEILNKVTNGALYFRIK